MSMVEAPVTTPKITEPGDHEKFAHVVVPKAAVTQAMVMGTPVTAVCGKTWIPSRKPEDFPVCPTCQEFLDWAKKIRDEANG